MGHRQQMTHGQRLEWDSMQYKASLAAKRGHNFTYWSDDKHNKLLYDGWKFYMFSINHNGKISQQDSTFSEEIAIDVKKSLVADDYHARVFCGYSKNIQRMKTFSVLYKLKTKK